MAVIEVRNLTKVFKEVTAVNDLSFTVEKGEVYGFLGQNGAGKSTTIRTMLSLIQPTSGSIKIFGHRLEKERTTILKNVGAIIEKPDLYTYLTAEENLRLFGKLSGKLIPKDDINRVLELTGIAARAKSRVRTFSQGMKQRLGIAVALLHDPQLIILDEPTNGLDPQGIADVRNLILHLSKEQGKTIFISSHLLSEIEKIADSMLIIDKGKKIAEGKVTQLMNPEATLIEIESLNPGHCLSVIRQSQFVEHLKSSEPIMLTMNPSMIPDLNRFLVQQDVAITAIRPQHSLEALFLSLTTPATHVEAYSA